MLSDASGRGRTPDAKTLAGWSLVRELLINAVLSEEVSSGGICKATAGA